jgi:hypothetical protein
MIRVPIDAPDDGARAPVDFEYSVHAGNRLKRDVISAEAAFAVVPRAMHRSKHPVRFGAEVLHDVDLSTGRPTHCLVADAYTVVLQASTNSG